MPPRSRLRAAALLALACVTLSRTGGAQADTTTRPRVLIITTGGTIAGVQQAPGTLGEYRAGALGAKELLAAVPVISDYARIETEAFAAVASTMITPAQWIALATRIDAVLRAQPDLAGVVVTHGTDRLEETAFFLYLTVRSEKPVVWWAHSGRPPGSVPTGRSTCSPRCARSRHRRPWARA